MIQDWLKEADEKLIRIQKKRSEGVENDGVVMLSASKQTDHSLSQKEYKEDLQELMLRYPKN